MTQTITASHMTRQPTRQRAVAWRRFTTLTTPSAPPALIARGRVFGRVLSTLAALPLLLAAHAVCAQTDPATAEALLRKSGLWQQFAEVPAQVRAGMAAAVAKSNTAPDPAATTRLLAAVDTAYAADRLQQVALDTVSKGLDRKYVPALQNWLDSATGMAVRKLEEAAAADRTEPEAVIREGTEILEAAPSTRRALIQNIVETTKAAEVLTDVTVNTVVAIQRGVVSMQTASPGATASPPADIRAALAAQRPQMLQAFGALATAGSAKTYRSLPTDELSRYAAFLQSDAGRHFNDLGAAALNAALVEASAEFGRRLADVKPAAP